MAAGRCGAPVLMRPRASRYRVELPDAKNSDPDQSDNQGGAKSLPQKLLGNLFPPGAGGKNQQHQAREDGEAVQRRVQSA